MGLIFLILVSLVFAAVVFTTLDRDPGRAAAVIGSLLTFVITFGAPFGVVIGAAITIGVVIWSRNRADNTAGVVLHQTTARVGE